MLTTKTHDGTMFTMPSLGADMTEGRITEWLVQPGDQVERGQIVVIVETDKSDIEVEVFEPAAVIELLAEEGDLVQVGTPIAVFQTVDLQRAPVLAQTGVDPLHEFLRPVLRSRDQERLARDE